MENVSYMVFDRCSGDFSGFYNSKEVVDKIILDNTNLRAIAIYNSIKDELLLSAFKVNVSILPSNDTTIDSMQFISIINDVVPDDIRLEQTKESICADINIMSGQDIERGMDIDIDGSPVRFNFSHGEQLRMKELIDNYNDDSIIYYAPDGGFELPFKCSDIRAAYKTLFNNKTYIYIYSDVFRKWVQEKLTIEMVDSKEEIFTYGYINDEISKEVDLRYERLKLL